MTLGERLLEYRTNLKMSQDALAEKLNVTRQTISKWETDQSTPEFNKILPLCEVFGITPDELIKGKKETQEEAKEGQEKNKENTIYNQEREKIAKQKAKVISTSVFLYIIGTFFPAFVEELTGIDGGKGVVVMVLLWGIATALLINFFVSHPKENTSKEEKEAKDKSKVIERRIIEIITLIFLLIYLVVSFATWEWQITWILWIVLLIVQAIVKIIFDIKRGEKVNGK